VKLTFALVAVGLLLAIGVATAEPAWEVYLSKTQDMDLIDIKEPVPVRNTVFVPLDDICAAAGATCEYSADANAVVIHKGDHTRSIACNTLDSGAVRINKVYYAAHDVIAKALFGKSYYSRGQSEINMVIDVEGD
jgi:hypothetical protein